MEICGPKGRDCIERYSTKSFNCITNCEGIYADVQWIEKKTEEEIVKDAVDKEKYKILIAEYRKFKTKIVKHFRFNSAGYSSSFGKP